MTPRTHPKTDVPRFSGEALRTVYTDVCRTSGVSDADMSSARLTDRIVAARMAFSVLARQTLKCTLEEIGATMYKDHSAISNQLRKYAKSPDAPICFRARAIVERIEAEARRRTV